MAGSLAAIGATVAIFVSVRDMNRRHRTNKPKQPTHPTSQLEVATQAPLAILGGLPTLPGGGATALKVAQLLGRNYPLVLLTALIGLLFWPTSRDNEETTRRADVETTIPAFKPNGSDEASPSLCRH
jgi:hypothetical protein